jgi:hypothetical protein
MQGLHSKVHGKLRLQHASHRDLFRDDSAKYGIVPSSTQIPRLNPSKVSKHTNTIENLCVRLRCLKFGDYLQRHVPTIASRKQKSLGALSSYVMVV